MAEKLILLDRHIDFQYFIIILSQIVTCIDKLEVRFNVTLHPYFAC